MTESIKSIYDDECNHLQMSTRFLKKVREYGQAFVNKNDDHVNFFGSNLLGVYPVRFRTDDKDEWFDDVLQADDSTLRQRVISLPTVDESWQRGTDPMNLSCLWLCHKIFNAQGVSSRAQEQGMIDVLMVLHFKLISSLMAHNFKYPADRSTALAVYASLSKKYAMKQYGNWYQLLESRCEDIIDKRSIHYNTIQTFDDDGDIQYMITDIQGRLRAIVKKMWDRFAQIREQDAKIITERGLVDVDGEKLVRDMSRNLTPYKRYIHEVSQDKTRLIKGELVTVVSHAMYTMPEKLLRETLEYVAANYGNRSDREIEDFIEEVMLHAFDYLSSDKSDFTRTSDLASLIADLRAVYMSSRSRDQSLLKMRKLGEKIVKKATRTRNNSTIASIRTGLMLYIITRALTRDHYQ